jgi:hypothetical protein
MSQWVTVKSDNQLSQQTVTLLVEMKHHLQRHGIAIKLADSNIVSHVLQAASSIDDDAIDQCRKRLLALNPNADSSQHVYLFSNSTGRVTCRQCHETINVRVQSQAGIMNPQVITCPCGEVFYIGRQARQYARKPTQLEGAYALERDDTIIGNMIVENLSYAGVRLRLTSSSGKIYRDDVLLIQFVLDNKHQTLIRLPIDVRYVQHDIIGAQFQNTYGIPKPLIEYLRS